MLRAGVHRATYAALAVLAAVALLPSPAASAAPATPARLASPSVAAVAVGRLDGPWGEAEEQAFVAKINQLRTGLGLAPLAVDPELTAQARIWADTMRDAGHIFHTSTLEAGISADWQKLGENVGVGGTVDDLFDAFVASPKHYENLVDPVYRYVGVGVVWDGARMYTTHRFMSLLPAAPAATAPKAAPTTAPRTTTTAAPEPTTTAPPTELAATDPAGGPLGAPAGPPPATGERIRLVLDALGGLDG